MLNGKNIILGITGGIAVYKAVEILRQLKKLKANVSVVMTKNAQKFVTPLTFQTLSQNRVYADMFDQNHDIDVKHISLAERADLILIAPATANIIGKFANGVADDLLSTLLLAASAPILIAPAMNTKMYNNLIVQENIKKLTSRHIQFIEPESGDLACGEKGKGRLSEIKTIIQAVLKTLSPKDDLKKKVVIVTAGPTQEAIDPARYISNHSSGKMGYALAKEARRRGAKVILISGPTSIPVPEEVIFLRVTTALEMKEAVLKNLKEASVVIKAAAVSDYKPKTVSKEKIKKKDTLVLELEKNPDILSEIGKQKGNKILVGFAAETEKLVKNAQAKITEKKLDFIVANDITQEGAGYDVDTNIVTIIDKHGNIENLPKMTKGEIAEKILDKVVELIKSKRKF